MQNLLEMATLHVRVAREQMESAHATNQVDPSNHETWKAVVAAKKHYHRLVSIHDRIVLAIRNGG